MLKFSDKINTYISLKQSYEFLLLNKKYTEAIQTRIEKWKEKNKNYTPEQAKDFIEELTTEFRDEIFEYKKLK